MPYADAILFDGAVGVFSGEIYRLLAGVGAAAWHAADGVSPAELHDRIRHQLPDPPTGVDTDARITETIGELTAGGLLTHP